MGAQADSTSASSHADAVVIAKAIELSASFNTSPSSAIPRMASQLPSMDTRADSASNPSNGTKVTEVFAIPELLEAILLGVDEKTLFLSQRTNKTFQATIRDSIKLQRKLGFLALSSESVADDPFPTNPLLLKRIGIFEQPTLVCNFFVRGWPFPSFEWHYRRCIVMEDYGSGGFLCSKKGSWRDLLVMRDGREARLGVTCYSSRGSCNVDVPDLEEGCTAGEFADSIEEAVGKAMKKR